MIDQRKKVATFYTQSQLSVAQSRLDAEGIKTWVEDELTVQSYNFLANAVGGIKLYVDQKDFVSAHAILVESGFIYEEANEAVGIEKLIDSPQKFNRFKKAITVLFITLGLLAVVMFIYFLMNLPSTSEKLMSNYWCMSHIEYQEEVFYPNSIKYGIISSYECNEEVRFYADYIVQFPGFNSTPVKGSWHLKGDSLIISNTDTLDFVYQKAFLMRLERSTLTLTSDSVVLHCFKKKPFRFRF